MTKLSYNQFGEIIVMLLQLSMTSLNDHTSGLKFGLCTDQSVDDLVTENTSPESYSRKISSQFNCSRVHCRIFLRFSTR